LALIWLSNLLLVLVLMCSEATQPTQFEADPGSVRALIGKAVCVCWAASSRLVSTPRFTNSIPFCRSSGAHPNEPP